MIKFNNKVNPPALLYNDLYKEEIINYINTNGVKSLSISSSVYKINNGIDFLLDLKTIENLYIEYLDDFNPNVFYHLPIKRLTLKTFPVNLELDKLHKLEYLNIEHTMNMVFKDLPITCKELILSKYKGEDLMTFFGENHIEKLTLNLTKLKKLEGIECFKNLKSISISYSPKLEDINSLSNVSNSLEYVEFHKCKALSDISIVSKLSNLLKVDLYEIGDVKTTSYFKNLKYLNTLFIRGHIKVKEKNKEDLNHIEKVVIADMKLMKGTW